MVISEVADARTRWCSKGDVGIFDMYQVLLSISSNPYISHLRNEQYHRDFNEIPNLNTYTLCDTLTSDVIFNLWNCDHIVVTHCSNAWLAVSHRHWETSSFWEVWPCLKIRTISLVLFQSNIFSYHLNPDN